MPTTDVSAFIGGYPYRQLAESTPDWLVSQMDRLGIDRAWVGYLPSVLHRDPRAGNEILHRSLEPHAGRLHAVPTINPGLPDWEDDVDRANRLSAPAARCYPMQLGLDPSGAEMRSLAAALAAAHLPLLLTVRFEDVRQRHHLDSASDLPAAAIRALVRSAPDLRALVTHADKSMVEEVHFGLTPGESTRILWDYSWIWGPPENHLSLVLETVGPSRFTLGTGMPLRVPDLSFAKIDLMSCDEVVRQQLRGGNIESWRVG